MSDQIPGSGQPQEDLEVSQVPPAARAPEPSVATTVLRQIVTGNALISLLAVLLALIVGAILIVAVDPVVQQTAGYFFSRPSDMLQAMWNAASGAYSSLFQGAIYNFGAADFASGIRPLTLTLTFATPLIVAGLGVALSFRVGLFNIGGQAQILTGAVCAGYVGFAFDLPPVIHLIAAIVAGVVGGALVGALVGVLKARTGAHEVIVTIMLNYIVLYLLRFLLRTPGALQAPGGNNPKTPPMKSTAIYPLLLGPNYTLHLGFIVSILATIVVWYLLNRSNLGFQFRAVGENPNAARVAGINVKNIYVWALAISAGLVGLAGVAQVLGTVTSGFGESIDAGVGFDAITVALLGRSRPWGVFAAGLLFGALKAGGFAMQANNSVPIDIILVVQSLIVLFIAAPPLVRAIFRLPQPPGSRKLRTPRPSSKKVVVTR
ncbi:MAG: putative sugar transporter, permease component [Glaciihabitans sp.]|nr:putative sugar transporter, permease component [Glaciihabitans sp.]MDQ1571846.1 ral nucleoside transport system permease protein [Actinomycetota bacterium]